MGHLFRTLQLVGLQVGSNTTVDDINLALPRIRNIP